MLVDSHCHLDFPDLSADLEAVVARARAAGVGRLLTICTKPSQVETTLAIAERFEEVYCAVGVHPHHAAQEPLMSVARLAELARHPKVVGIGETGLDFHYDFSPRDVQEASFRTHIAAARETGLPLIVHTREADAETLRVLRDGAAGGDPARPLRGLIHCFSSGPALAEGALAIGLDISFSGILTFKGAEAVRQAAALVPLDRALVETDAPYLAPVPKRGKPNEPSYVAYTAAKLAEVKGVSVETAALETSRTFFRLFDKVPAPQRFAA